MTQIFDEEGKVQPVTAIKAGPVVITQVKNSEKDGYKAVQVGFGYCNEKKTSKPLIGHFAGSGPFRFLREFGKGNDVFEYSLGDTFDVGAFSEGDKVKISSISKGKGFQGVVKRYNFAGGPRSHGQKHSEREPGSIGAMGHARVQKGTKMPGRMGGKRVTMRGLKIVAIDEENNIIYLKGAIPGKKGTLVEIKSN